MAGPQREPVERVGANQFVGPVEVFRNRWSPVLPVRLRLTRPVSEINSRRSEQDANPCFHCTFRNVHCPPGAEPCRPKPEGCWTVSTVTAPKGSLAHTPHSIQRADSPRVYFATMALLYHRPCHMIAEPGAPAQADTSGRHGCKQPCLQPWL